MVAGCDLGADGRRSLRDALALRGPFRCPGLGFLACFWLASFLPAFLRLALFFFAPAFFLPFACSAEGRFRAFLAEAFFALGLLGRVAKWGLRWGFCAGIACPDRDHLGVGGAMQPSWRGYRANS